MKAGFIINAWKYPIFERHLQQGGYSFVQHEATKDKLFLIVTTENPEALGRVIAAAYVEALMTGPPTSRAPA